MTLKYRLGIDIGSTTVKYVVCDNKLEIKAKAYTPHNTKQAETLLKLLEILSLNHPQIYANIESVYITGSGASPISSLLNAYFIQEVNAVVLAVERLHPDVNAVIELGGQDAKIIHFRESNSGSKSVLASMNDKCASGTGATIERCMAKVGLSQEEIQNLDFNANKLHKVAAKCGVFAETDIVNLLKSSIPSDEIMNSLANAIVMQNLTVLTRGNTLMPNVLLLGGPNSYLPFLQQCWRMRIAELWRERGISFDNNSMESLVKVPINSQYYAAFGAIIFAENDLPNHENFAGLDMLREAVKRGGVVDDSREEKALVETKEELDSFIKKYTIPIFKREKLVSKRECYLGIDGGSTSSKAVLVDKEGAVLIKVYQLSKGNPIQDTIELLEQISLYDNYGYYDIKGLGVTGYAGDVLEGAFGADVNIVETTAHAKSAKEIFGDSIDVICDIGGQDIKVLFLENGIIKNFRLSNQCSAGNGSLLQSMAKQFGVEIESFASFAFSAKKAPCFNYGCAVFLDSDRVNFQKEGYSKEELFAGIAKVLPKNIWQYVVQISNLKALGRHFILQGGTQYNLAAVKAQVDYIKERVPTAIVDVHPHCGEAGAIGVALETRDSVIQRGYSRFIGLELAKKLTYNSYTNETTRCNFCSINCSRTFIDTQVEKSDFVRYIAGFSCEKGSVASTSELKTLKKTQKKLYTDKPNLLKEESTLLFDAKYNIEAKPSKDDIVQEQLVRLTLGGWGPTFRRDIKRRFKHSSPADKTYRQNLKIAIPKVLNIYSLAPFFRVYLEALDISTKHIYFSNFSNEKMFLEGSKYGSVDACYPAKVAQAHIYSFMFSKKFKREKINVIWFPAIIDMKGFVEHTMGETTCPIVSGTPRVIYSSFIKEQNLFKKLDIDYIDDSLNFGNIELLKKQIFKTWAEHLKITEDESNWGVEQGLNALKQYHHNIEKRGKELLQSASKNREIVILLIGRPYHADRGLNHDILDMFQSLGYPILSIASIPKDKSYLEHYFGKEIETGQIESALDIRDVWQENFSVNSAQKVWAAKFASRHPNIAVVDLSSFKCGHDAPTYSIIDKILATSKTPHLMLHDIDVNKPTGSIKIRVNTFAHTLRKYQEQLKIKER